MDDDEILEAAYGWSPSKDRQFRTGMNTGSNGSGQSDLPAAADKAGKEESVWGYSPSKVSAENRSSVMKDGRRYLSGYRDQVRSGPVFGYEVEPWWSRKSRFDGYDSTAQAVADGKMYQDYADAVLESARSNDYMTASIGSPHLPADPRELVKKELRAKKGDLDRLDTPTNVERDGGSLYMTHSPSPIKLRAELEQDIDKLQKEMGDQAKYDLDEEIKWGQQEFREYAIAHDNLLTSVPRYSLAQDRRTWNQIHNENKKAGLDSAQKLYRRDGDVNAAYLENMDSATLGQVLKMRIGQL